jgi:hypothetical protein
VERRWLFALGFGLVHGFGFAFALRESLQFAGSHVVPALAAVNLGVEIGQVAVLMIAVPALALVFRRALPERAGGIVLSALIAHSAWHWMTERGRELALHDVPAPSLGAVSAVTAIRAIMIAVTVALCAWGATALAARLRQRKAASAGTVMDPAPE